MTDIPNFCPKSDDCCQSGQQNGRSFDQCVNERTHASERSPGNCLENNTDIPEIDIKVDSVAVTAQTKKLKAKWTPELQQDINAIPEMIEKYYSGAEIVFGIRKSRTGEPIFKKVTGILFNKIPIYEPGLSQSILNSSKKNCISFTTDYEKSIKKSSIIFIPIINGYRKKL